MGEASARAAKRFAELVFSREAPGRSFRAFRAVTLAALFLVGIAHWVLFFWVAEKEWKWRPMTFAAYDWPSEYIFLSTLQDAVEEGVLPYHVDPPIKRTTRFFGIPAYPLSPQVLLLRVLDIQTFVTANTLILYAAGFVGCLLIRRRYRLSLFSFTALFLLFNFNGNLTAHMGAGVYVWGAFLLLPFFGLLVLRLVEGDATPLWPLGMALLLFVIMIQGTYHFYDWCAGFLLLLALFDRRCRGHALKAVALSVPLVAVRLLPAAVTFWGGAEDRHFISGYPTLEDLFAALLVVKKPTTEPMGVLGNLYWFEYDAYFGLIGAALVAFFGVALRFMDLPAARGLEYEALDRPSAVMALLSMSVFFAPVCALPIPLLNAERVSSRFLLVPLFLATLLACLRMDRLLPELLSTGTRKLMALCALVQMGVSLAVHSTAWRVSAVEAPFATQGWTAQLFDDRFHLVSRADPFYTWMVNASIAVSLSSLGVLGGVAAWRWLGRRAGS